MTKADVKEFIAYGPFTVPVDRRVRIARSLLSFWDDVYAAVGFDLSSCRGVYVFAMRASRGFTPLYVGKAARTTFWSEAFAAHKRQHYDFAIRSYKRGTPVIFFVAHPSGRGKPNLSMIDEVEGALIALAWNKNHDLSNVRRRPKQSWAIGGVLLGGSGRRTNSANTLRRTLGLG